MSGKDESAAKKKKAAQQKQIAENQMIAKALKVTYHAACKAMDVKPQKTLVQSIDQAEDGVKVIDKVAFRDYTVRYVFRAYFWLQTRTILLDIASVF